MKKTKAKMITGAEAVILSLLEEGVDIMFGYPGGANMPIYDALYQYQDKLKHILTRHEQGAMHAAQGYARISDKVGVCIATSGPGATNLLTGMADAQIDSTPLVCFTGQVAKELLGSDAFQETDIISISMPITKWNYQITKASEIPEVIARAFYLAKTGRPGPVLIDITKNAQFETLVFDYKKCEHVRSYVPKPKPDSSKIKEAANHINKAKKPFVVFGQGVSLGNAEKEFKDFIEKAGIPSASTLLGLSSLPTQHPLYVGMVGMHGNYAPNVLTNECDVLIAIGMRFDDRVTGNLETYAKQAKIIHFELDPSEIDKNVKTDIAILGDVKETLTEILPLIEEKNHSQWLSNFVKLNKQEYNEVIFPSFSNKGSELNMTEVIFELNKQTGGNAVIVSDVGQHQMIACRYTDFKDSRSNITSGGLGTMGFSLPAAIGAKLATPDRQVIAIMGDGGAQMNIQELGTVMQTEVPVKIIVLNNSFLGLVRQWQEMFFDKRYASTELINPDFITIAKAYSINAKSISKKDELSAAINELLDSKTSYLLEVKVKKETNVFPMIPTGASVSDVRLK